MTPKNGTIFSAFDKTVFYHLFSAAAKRYINCYKSPSRLRSSLNNKKVTNLKQARSKQTEALDATQLDIFPGKIVNKFVFKCKKSNFEQ